LDTLHYRFATVADCAELAALNRLLIEQGADWGEPDPAALERRMRRWLAADDYRAVLFHATDGTTLAYALFREHAGEINLGQFLVLPHARRHGIGRRAVELLRAHIWPTGRRLTLEVLIDNHAARDFWHALGYRDCAVALEIPAGASVTSNLRHGTGTGMAPLRTSPRH
jgi:GNAT superfamily N-acetyltransferase